MAGGYRFHRGYFPERTNPHGKVRQVLLPAKVGTKMKNGKIYIDYKTVDELRRLLTANGKMSSRQRTKLSSMMQRHASTAGKRARNMALLPSEGDTR